MSMMPALVKDAPSLSLCSVPRPTPRADEVVVRVAVAGLCRTDLYVADGKIPSANPLILGHEFSGTVHLIGTDVSRLAPGHRVAVMPILSCGTCMYCRQGLERVCPQRSMLGVDRDGAFAEFVAVPARFVHPIPAGMSFQAAAYAEPVTAALGVLNAGLDSDRNGLIYGNNRFSHLLLRVLALHGFQRVGIHDPKKATLSRDCCDFLIETVANAEAVAEMIQAVRPLGTIVFKSRQPRPTALDLLSAIPKELTFRTVHHGSFVHALQLLAEGRLDLSGLLGPAAPLADWERVFALARRGEQNKFFFSLADQ
jgi:L-iditol 2-dehydrogenase